MARSPDPGLSNNGALGTDPGTGKKMFDYQVQTNKTGLGTGVIFAAIGLMHSDRPRRNDG
jgi:hypothetical protein